MNLNKYSYKTIGILVGILSGCLWGLNDVFTNIFSSKMDVITTAIITIIFSLLLAFVQDFTSSISILSYHFFKNKVTFFNQLKKTKKVIFILIIAAIFAGPFGMVAGIAGISYAGPIYAGVITSCYPITALILSIIFLKERPTKLKIIGIIISVIAVIFISIIGSNNGGISIITGIIFAFCAMLGWGAESILFSLALKKVDNLDTSFLLAIRQLCSMISYFICLFIILIFYSHDVKIVFDNFFTTPIMIFLCIITAMTSYLAYYNTIKVVGASLGTTFNATFIFWAGIFSILFQISHITMNFVIWGIILILGIYFATKD